MNFNEYLSKHTCLYSETKSFSASLLSYLECAYEKHGIKVATFFNMNNDNSENDIYNKVNNLIRQQYKIKFHNIGKNPYQRYYKIYGGFEWLKLETYLIQHFYSINKSETYISNKKLAISLGYIDELENDKKSIQKACRKITDSLAILKNNRKTVSVEQRFNANKRGSGHTIKADWMRIIDLYTQYDDQASGSIRFRKAIRYRIISLLKNIKKFGTALAELLRKQKYKYLKGLIEFTESENFNDHKFAVFKVLEGFTWMAISPSELNTDNIVPHYDHPNLILEAKSERIYHELTYKNYVVEDFKRIYNVNTTIKPIF